MTAATERVHWQDRALCAQIGGEWWFPGIGAGVATDAKRICRRCPVRRACLEDAMAAEDGLEREMRAGVWGGLGPGQRERLDRRRRQGVAA